MRPNRTDRNRHASLDLILTISIIGVLAPPVPPTHGFQCPTLPPPADTVIETALPVAGQEGAVAIDECGRFVLSWLAERIPGTFNHGRVLVQRNLPDATPVTSYDQLTPDSYDTLSPERYQPPSVAISAFGIVRVGWPGACDDCHDSRPPQLLLADFPFDSPPQQPVVIPPGPLASTNYEPSVGIAELGAAVTWSAIDQPLDGLLRGATPDDPTRIRPCGTFRCFTSEWEPCASMTGAGFASISWAEPANYADEFPLCDIALQVYQPSGTSFPGTVTVNQPISVNTTDERSPAVDIDDSGNLVVVWVGPAPENSLGPPVRVYARRLRWTIPGPTVTPVGGQFFVDTDTNAIPLDFNDTNPTVALTRGGLHPGRFVVAWNVDRPNDPGAINTEIRARYFEADGQPRGSEFRVNVSTAETGPPGLNRRLLADSAQHTLAYGPQGQVVATWTAYASNEFSLADQTAYYTYLPPTFIEDECAALVCLKGDCNTDGSVDGDDIQPFFAVLLDPSLLQLDTGNSLDRVVDLDKLCRVDLNKDCSITIEDVQPFVCALLGEPLNCTPDSAMAAGGEGAATSGEGESGGGDAAGYAYIPSPAEQAYMDWLRDNTYWPLRHAMTIEEYAELARQMAVDLGVVKRWPAD